MNKLMCLGLLIPLLSACDHKSGGSGTPKEEQIELVQFSLAKEDLSSLVDIFDQAEMVVEKLEDWPKELEVRFFLSKLHPVLPKLLEKESSIGEYKFLAFKKIPQEVRNDILESTLPDSDHPGYAVFRKATWSKLFELQDSGYRIGFLNPGPKNRISGIYSHERKQIGIDVLASEGTLVHELRHAEQYLATDATRLGKIEGLSQECYSRVSSMFAETDSTNVELPTWLGSMNKVRFEADWYNDRDRVLATAVDPVNYPFAQNFDTAMDYPSKRAREVQYASDCPDELKAFAVSLEEKMDRFNYDIGYASHAFSLNRGPFLYSKRVYMKNCDANGNPLEGSVWAKKSCDNESTDYSKKLGSAKEYQKNFDKLLDDDIVTRSLQLKEVYATAPYFKEFCREMPGFKFYANCE